jgi:hypothetical protein
MTPAAVGYESVYAWVKQGIGRTHRTVGGTVAWAVLCMVVAQRVTPAALARALPYEQAGSGRSCLRRVRRWWQGPAWAQAEMSPQVIRQALRVPPSAQAVVVAMDTTRVGPWEVGLAGIVVGGRSLPIGWAGIPYPWPKGHYRATTLALITQLQAAFPPGVRWSVVAARGFPSAALFAQLRAGGTDCSIRLRLNDWVRIAGVYAKVREHLAAGRLRVGQRTAATVGNGQSTQPLVRGWVVVSAAVAPPPPHKQNPGTQRERLTRARRHARHRQHKRGRKTTPPSALAQRYAQTWVLFATAPTKAQAVREYACRMASEETFRDWHHHWAVRTAPVSLPTEAMVTRLIGTVCRAYTLQLLVGSQVGRTPTSQRRRAQWTVTGRSSWFWCGHRVFTDPGYDWSSWLTQQWVSLGFPSPPALPVPRAEPEFALAA